MGACTLVEIADRIVMDAAGEDPRWGGVIVTIFILSWGTVSGVLGMVYHAAAGHSVKPSLLRYAAILFFPLLWLEIKIMILICGPTALGALGYHILVAPDISFKEWLPAALFHIVPFAEFAYLLLHLYSIPLCILYRERAERGAPIRRGLKLFLFNPRDSRKLLVLVLVVGAIAAAAHYFHGPESQDAVPSVPEGLTILLMSYLTLVAIFGATRVALGGRDPHGQIATGADRSAPATDPPG